MFSPRYVLFHFTNFSAKQCHLVLCSPFIKSGNLNASVISFHCFVHRYNATIQRQSLQSCYTQQKLFIRYLKSCLQYWNGNNLTNAKFINLFTTVASFRGSNLSRGELKRQTEVGVGKKRFFFLIGMAQVKKEYYFMTLTLTKDKTLSYFVYGAVKIAIFCFALHRLTQGG